MIIENFYTSHVFKTFVYGPSFVYNEISKKATVFFPMIA